MMRFLLLMLVSLPVWAHYPVMTCELDGDQILCEVGFSDGSKAIGKKVQLITYDDEVLAVQVADKFSRVTFKKPEGEYYIHYDSGHEFPVEVDYGEL